MHRSHTLITRFVKTWEALRDGAITLRHAEAVVEGASSLSTATPDERAEYERQALMIAVSESPGRTLVMARALAASILPAVVAEQHRAALERRGAHAYSLDDGLGQLSLTGPEYLVRAAHDRATEMAKAMIADRCLFGPADQDADTRSLDQVRADIMLDLLLAGRADTTAGTSAESVHATVQVTIAATTLTGSEDRMAELDGFGPMLPEQARELAVCAPLWSRLFLGADAMVTVTDAYTPSASMRRHLRARDQRCRFPGCRRAARRCQIDHNHDHAKGGATEISNLSCFCVGHHTLKHPDLRDRHRWSATQLPGGVIAWTSPAGRTFIDEPPPRVMFV